MSTAEKTRPHPLDQTHVLDWAALSLGHPRVSRRVVTIADDFDVVVHGMEEIEGGHLPIGVILMTHGFAYKGKDVKPMATGMIREAARFTGRQRARDVLVVTIDQRNHGDRYRYKNGITFLGDMQVFGTHLAMALREFGCKRRRRRRKAAESDVLTAGAGVQDHQLIRDFLAGQLFPRDERRIDEWMSCGFSMGGHVTWRQLRDDPRLTIAVTICATPPETLGRKMLTSHAAGAYFLAKDTRDFFDISSPKGTYSKKKILTLHGEEDKVLPETIGTERWAEIAQEAAAANKWIQPGRGHVVTPEMVTRAAEWCWRFGLTEQ